MVECTNKHRYIGSRIYLHNPPGHGNPEDAQAKARREAHIESTEGKESKEEVEEPKMSQWSCLLVFCIAIPLTAVTAEWVCTALFPFFFSLRFARPVRQRTT